MPDTTILLLLAATFGLALFAVIAILRTQSRNTELAAQHEAVLAQLAAAQAERFQSQDKSLALLQQALTQGFASQDKTIGLTSAAITQAANQQAEQLRQFSASLAQSAQQNNEQLRLFSESLSQSSQQQTAQLRQFSDSLHRLQETLNTQIEQLRTGVEGRLKALQDDNTRKLDEMRQTVDEKLQTTLEARLGESFKQVSDRLEQVYRGLGEMQSLAAGVGDLKRVLTNVKTRGTWGELRLESLLEQMLTPDQYERNVKPVPGSNAIVEFAIKLPGRKDGEQPVWLPVDAKFPKEQYERLLDAFDQADAEAVAVAGKALETAIKTEAKGFAEKYLSPPHTTDFGILFLPTEGLYAEIVKRAGLVDTLQRDHRVTVAGPVTLTTLLNALQLGFRTLALEKRSSEVWQVLGAVKTEFGKFGEILAKTRDTLEKAAKNIEGAETRTRAMERKLRSVEALAPQDAAPLLGLDDLVTGGTE